ncbi:acyltransferase family protein [Paracraurococcus ruber]|uniref:Acyltransferase 3 domain-containing protein n=1 Tax=Paracraurococcus ruber TaxID=77675 RepID=A0ABS1CR44_9PROT|nr:acyltransferase family protein [Paracraurococcus ruber]MBK1656921.1 hypothetical protein [Paracraurococcus ruber]TDG33288.1 hypothetical protein E2C05_04150 [Paracraurococcus ruber]
MTTLQTPFDQAASQAAPARVSRGAELPLTIEVARVLLVIGLVFLHYFAYPNSRTSPFLGYDPVHHPFATFVNSFVLLFFFSAVPLLSAISGWLFFNLSARPMATIGRRIRGRVSSLLLPLVTWNLLTLLAGYLLYLAVPTSGLRGEFGFDFAAADAFGVLDAVLGLTRLPIAFQFWFVHDLFLTVLVSPLLWLLLRHAPLLGAVGLCAAWLAEATFGIFIRTDVLFFFYLGGLARVRGTDLRIAWRTARWLLLGYALLMAARALAPAWFDLTDPQQREMLDLATRLARPLGVVACWGACLRLAETPLGEAVGRYGGFAFFLHAAHFPTIAFAKFALWRLVPVETDGWMIAHYVASVALTIGIVGAGAVLVFRLSPTLYAFLAGGRRLA